MGGKEGLSVPGCFRSVSVTGTSFLDLFLNMRACIWTARVCMSCSHTSLSTPFRSLCLPLPPPPSFSLCISANYLPHDSLTRTSPPSLPIKRT